MPDFVAPTAHRTLAEQAVAHVLARVVNDPDFRHHMLLTATLEKSLRAEAEWQGLTYEQAQSQLKQQIDARGDIGPARVVDLNKQIDSLQRELTEMDAVFGDRQPNSATLRAANLEELLERARQRLAVHLMMEEDERLLELERILAGEIVV